MVSEVNLKYPTTADLLISTTILRAEDFNTLLESDSIELAPAPGVGKILWPISIAMSATKLKLENYYSLFVFLGENEYIQYFFSKAGGFQQQIDLGDPLGELDEDFFGFWNVGGSGPAEPHDNNLISQMENLPIIAKADGTFEVGGAAVTSTLVDPGTGYQVGEVVQHSSYDATFVVTTIGGAGEILTYTPQNPGTVVPIGVYYLDVGGNGNASLNISEIDITANPIRAKIEILYRIFDVNN